MKTPNIWIGIGPYGDAFLRMAAARLEMLSMLGRIDRAAQPILCHLRANEAKEYLPHPHIAYVRGENGGGLKELRDAVTRSFHPEVRKGNRRGTGYFFVFCHADDLCGIPGIDSSDHWLWMLPQELGFSMGYLALIVAADPSADVVGRDADMHDDKVVTKLSAISSAVRQAVQDAGGQQQLIILRPVEVKASFDDPDAKSASVDTAVLLFDLLGSMEHDPTESSALRALVEQPIGLKEWQPTCASFGIKAFGVDFDSVAIQVSRDLGRAILQSIEGLPGAGAVKSTGDERDIPDIKVPPPSVPGEVSALRFEFTTDIFEGPEESKRRLNRAEASLSVAAEKWWELEARPDFSDFSGSREAAGRQLEGVLCWLSELILSLWTKDGATATRIVNTLESAREKVVKRHPAAGQHPRIALVSKPDFSTLIERLRDALLNRPRAWTALLLLSMVALASGFAGYAATVWLSSEFSQLTFLEQWLFRAIVLLVGIGLILLEPVWRWFLGPRRKVQKAVAAVDQATSKAVSDVKKMRTGFAKYVGAVTQGEVVDRYVDEIRLAEQRFRDLNAALIAERGRGVDARDGGSTANLFENLELRLGREVDIPPFEELSASFRRQYVPTRLSLPREEEGEEPGDAPKEFKPDQLREIVGQFFKQEILQPLISKPLVDLSDIRRQDIDVDSLVFVQDFEQVEMFLHSDYRDGVEPEGDTEGARPAREMRVLARGDKCYVLGVSRGIDIQRAVKNR